MKVCIFDTETTGLPLNSKIPGWVHENNWPHIVSMSWIILDADTNEITKTRSYVVYPQNWIIPEESTKIHKITQQEALEKGYYLEVVLDEFLNEECDMYIAHNLNFDYNVILHATNWDIGRIQTKIDKEFKCSMEPARYICKIPWMYRGYKPPKLSEFYKHVFGHEPESGQLHNSLYDVQILTDILKNNREIRMKLGLPVKPLTNNNAGKKGSYTLIL